MNLSEVNVELQVAIVKIGQAGELPQQRLWETRSGKYTGAAAPWSVPRLAFSCTRRPNSLKVITNNPGMVKIR